MEVDMVLLARERSDLNGMVKTTSHSSRLHSVAFHPHLKARQAGRSIATGWPTEMG